MFIDGFILYLRSFSTVNYILVINALEQYKHDVGGQIADGADATSCVKCDDLQLRQNKS